MKIAPAASPEARPAEQVPPKFSGAPVPEPPHRPLPAADLSVGMLENNRMTRPKRAIDFIVSGMAHSAIVALAILIPLLFAGATGLTRVETTYLVEPPPPPPPPPAPAALVHAVVRPKLFSDSHTLYAPRVIPKKIAQIKDLTAPQSSEGVAGGVPGGVPGGVMGGVLGGVLGGSTHFAPPPPPPKVPVQARTYRVGGQVQPPVLVYKVQPKYPPLAKDTHVQGDVVLDCVIDPRGDVTQMHVLSGQPLLIQAAYAAVGQWKYRPTLLNGVPVSVAMEVTVHFSMGG